MRAYDLMKAELDCSMISLECCKEEKEKLEAFLQECKEEKSRISVELSIVKELLEASTSTMNVQKEKDSKLKDGCFSDEWLSIMLKLGTLILNIWTKILQKTPKMQMMEVTVQVHPQIRNLSRILYLMIHMKFTVWHLSTNATCQTVMQSI
ncbi:hypothetical protein V6Z12_D06G046000 [Gossypium hirsutum]